MKPQVTNPITNPNSEDFFSQYKIEFIKRMKIDK
jgi:hypothetical protein